MRKILFRGQTRRKGERVWMDGSPVDSNWVYGGIFPNNDGGDFAIIYQQEPEIEKFPVWADTVGQYIGHEDRNKQKIFDGDILAGFKYPYLHNGEHNYFAEVVWFEGSSAFGIVTHKNPKSNVRGVSDGICDFLDNFDSNDWEVIGNIYDDTELIADEKGE